MALKSRNYILFLFSKGEARDDIKDNLTFSLDKANILHDGCWREISPNSLIKTPVAILR